MRRRTASGIAGVARGSFILGKVCVSRTQMSQSRRKYGTVSRPSSDLKQRPRPLRLQLMPHRQLPKLLAVPRVNTGAARRGPQRPRIQRHRRGEGASRRKAVTGQFGITPPHPRTASGPKSVVALLLLLLQRPKALTMEKKEVKRPIPAKHGLQ